MNFNNNGCKAEWGWERERILFKIHNNIWPTELLESPFDYVYRFILTSKERRIVCYKIDGYVDGEISIKMKIQLGTVKRHIYNIRSKYRNQMDVRADNDPEIRKRKGFIVRKKRRH